MAGRWLSPGTLMSSTNKTDYHSIAEILLKVALNTITLILTQKGVYLHCHTLNDIFNIDYFYNAISHICKPHFFTVKYQFLIHSEILVINVDGHLCNTSL